MVKPKSPIDTRRVGGTHEHEWKWMSYGQDVGGFYVCRACGAEKRERPTK